MGCIVFRRRRLSRCVCKRMCLCGAVCACRCVAMCVCEVINICMLDLYVHYA